MGYRKLIKFGNSSHIITIPETWLKKNNLNKGDTVYLEENGNNELVLMPEKKEYEEKLTEILIDTQNKTILEIKREIISAYINNFRIIRVIGSEVKNKFKEIRDILNNLLAIEIIEQTSDRIVAQDFLNIKQTSLNTIIRRIDTLIRSMLMDVNFQSPDENYSNILIKDSDVNKLSYLAFRVIKKGLYDQNIAKEIEETSLSLLDSWLLVSTLEKIGDSIKRISRTSKAIPSNKKKIDDIEKLFDGLKLNYETIMAAYYNHDAKKARQISEEKNKALFECARFCEKHQEYRLNLVIKHFKDVHSFMGDISRIVHLVGVHNYADYNKKV